ncbi:MAG: hypothetical protein HY079_03985 [Elusimicrobia bacterium]|nr:hypothetical protein [Elusimicrobiota bacterium]
MRTLYTALLAALLAGSASASELGIIKKQRGAVRRGGATAQPHTSPRAAAPYAAPSGSGGAGAAAGTVSYGSGVSASPSAAPGAMTFRNGKPLGTGRTQGASGAPKLLRAAGSPSAAASAAAAPASAPRGYTATAAGPASTTGGGSGRIAPDPRGAHPTSGAGVGSQDAPDSAPGQAGGGAKKDPLSSILDGLAGMFKDMANMLGGGTKGDGG